MSKNTQKAFQLKITLKDSKPPIWRRLVVPADFTFHDLHLTIQTAFDWMNYHLYSFEKSRSTVPALNNFGYGFSDNSNTIVDLSIEGNEEVGGTDSREEKIKDYFKNKGNKIIYTYDFGDDWEHEIVLEEIVEGYGFDYPQCLKAVRCAPCEDSGGIWGWESKMDIMQNYDSKNQEHVELFEWLKGMLSEMEALQNPADFNPNEVDLEFINERLENYEDIDGDLY